MSIPQEGGGPIESRDQLAAYLEAGCKPKADWRIGTEHEKFGYCLDTRKPIPYDGDRSIRALLEGQHRAVDAALQFPEADQDLAHKIAAEIRRKNDLLIVNLTSLR